MLCLVCYAKDCFLRILVEICLSMEILERGSNYTKKLVHLKIENVGGDGRINMGVCCGMIYKVVNLAWCGSGVSP